MRNTLRRLDERTKPRSRLASLPASRTGVVRDARPPHYAGNAQITDRLRQRTELTSSLAFLLVAERAVAALWQW